MKEIKNEFPRNKKIPRNKSECPEKSTPKLAVVAEYSPGSVESIFINNQEIIIIFSSGYQTISKSSLIE